MELAERVTTTTDRIEMIGLEISSGMAGSTPARTPVADKGNVSLDQFCTAPAIQLGPLFGCLVAVAAGWPVAGEAAAAVAVV